MNNFNAFSIAGVLMCSMSVQASFIDVPSHLKLDINASTALDPSLYSYEIEDGNPDTVAISLVGEWTVESENYFSFWIEDGPIDPLWGLEAIFYKGLALDWVTKEGKLPAIYGPKLGESYLYTFDYTVEHFLGGRGGPSDNQETFSGSTIVTFFDSTAVPVGPTAPLLAAGLAGFWLRRKQK
ncbi:MAG: hypothetical protein CME36_12185 [unclassified Hahellaceae]|nr:hypothetical protein [Hahellaceae bacterium]|tara:strand:+ start:142363 stop:142908 length:546 start_codon:yes stop_codon:yes gene_type:complete